MLGVVRVLCRFICYWVWLVSQFSAPGSSATSGGWDVHFILPWSGSAGLPLEVSGFGYIVGFIFAAGIVGYLAERHWDRKPWILLGMFLGNVVLYIPGTLWLAYLVATDWVHPVGKPLGELITGSGTWDKVLKGGVYPFIVGDFMKLFFGLPDSACSLVSGTNQRSLEVMEITWLGHSCFRLRSEDLVVITDPYPASVGLRPDSRPATAVTVSNPHPHHSSWADVGGEPKVFQNPGEYEYSGIAVRGVMTPFPLGKPEKTVM